MFKLPLFILSLNFPQQTYVRRCIGFQNVLEPKFRVDLIFHMGLGLGV